MALGNSYDSSGTSNGNAGSVVSWTHNVGSGSNGILFAYFFNGGTAPPISNGSLKYAGTNMTLFKSGTQTGDPFSLDIWYIKNPPAGLGTFNGTFKAVPSGGEYDCLSESYFGVNQLTPFAGSSISIGTNNSTGGSVTRGILGADWWVGAIAYDNNTGTTAIGNFRGTAGSGAMLLAADSTGGTLRWTNTNNSSNFVAIGVELVPSVGLVQSTGTAAIGLGSSSVSWANNTTTGDLIVVGVNITNVTTLGTVSAVTDTQGNLYTKALSGTKASGVVSVIDQELWYATNITGGAGSVTVQHTVDNVAIIAQEYTGGWNTLDAIGTASGSSSFPNTGTTNTTQGTELLLVATGDDNIGGGQSWAPAGKYHDVNGTATTLTGVSFTDALQQGTAAQTGTLVLGNASDWVSLFASFYQAAAGGGTVTVGYKGLLGVGN